MEINKNQQSSFLKKLIEAGYLYRGNDKILRIREFCHIPCIDVAAILIYLLEELFGEKIRCSSLGREEEGGKTAYKTLSKIIGTVRKSKNKKEALNES